MEIITVCQEMGWTYKQYMQQPTWFIASLKDKLQLDNVEMEKINNKAK